MALGLPEDSPAFRRWLAERELSQIPERELSRILPVPRSAPDGIGPGAAFPTTTAEIQSFPGLNEGFTPFTSTVPVALVNQRLQPREAGRQDINPLLEFWRERMMPPVAGYPGSGSPGAAFAQQQYRDWAADPGLGFGNQLEENPPWWLTAAAPFGLGGAMTAGAGLNNLSFARKAQRDFQALMGAGYEGQPGLGYEGDFSGQAIPGIAEGTPDGVRRWMAALFGQGYGDVDTAAAYAGALDSAQNYMRPTGGDAFAGAWSPAPLGPDIISALNQRAGLLNAPAAQSEARPAPRAQVILAPISSRLPTGVGVGVGPLSGRPRVRQSSYGRNWALPYPTSGGLSALGRYGHGVMGPGR